MPGSSVNCWSQTKSKLFKQGILSVPGIAGYEWEPARIGRFLNTNYFHNIPMANKKQEKHFPCSVFPGPSPDAQGGDLLL